MNERSIILHAHEVRRLLGAGEAQIWRPMRPQPSVCKNVTKIEHHPNPECHNWLAIIDGAVQGIVFVDCPFHSGEWRWVKETWAWTPAGDYCNIPLQPPEDRFYYKATAHSPNEPGWKSPVTMPRWASRLIVEILDVEARRVQEITEEEAREAGVPLKGCLARDKFAHDWSRRYAKRGLGWDKNPWAWKLEVKKL